MLFLGVDPGRLGAVAWISGGCDVIQVYDTPLAGDGYDFAGMNDLLARARCHEEAIQATVEDTISVPHRDKSGNRFLPSSDKGLHMSLGAWLALLGAAHITTTLAAPKTWKRSMLAGIANDEAAEAMALERRFPGRDIHSLIRGPKGGLKDGRVDALFLAEYGRALWKLAGNR
jgi:hypothetical protein